MDLKARLEALRSAPKPNRQPDAAPAEEVCMTCMVQTRPYPLDYSLGGVKLADYLHADGSGWYTLFGEDMPPPEHCLFIDTETTGLGGAGTSAFLVGLGYYEDGAFVVAQYLMRDYPQERDMLRCVAQRAGRAQALVSFNGKSFDLPLLDTRFRINRMDFPFEGHPHFDLLHAARRLWRGRLSGVSLGRLEAEILRAPRVGDLDGSEVPGRYFRFLQTGDASLLEDILSHNLQDILSMPLLAAVMLKSAADPLSLSFDEDVRAVGRMRELREDVAGAADCYRQAGACGNARAQAQLGLLYKRRGTRQQALAHWELMAESGQGGILPLIELAKLYEHKLKQPERALHYTQGAAAKLRAMGVGIAAPEMEEVMRRMRRLQRRVLLMQDQTIAKGGSNS